MMVTEKQYNRCAVIINAAAVAAGGIGALPMSGSDALALERIQLAMLLQLAEVFGYSKTELTEEQLVNQAFMKNAGVLLVAKLSQAIPGTDRLIRGVVASTLTESLGWHQVRVFDENQL